MQLNTIVRALSGAACGAFVLAAVATPPVRADDVFFSYLGADAPAAPPRVAGPVGSWSTTVMREPVAAVATTAPVRLASAGPLATGSLASSTSKPAAAGPRLTGTQHALSGQASYYWQGQMTATGERFDKRALTAAHRTLPFGTRVRVTRVDTGNSVVVRINDRGPFKPGRVIDLSERAAEDIGMAGAGVTAVKLEVLGQ